MNIGQQLLFLISAFGALNGIILGLYMLFRYRKRSLPTLFLTIMLITISLKVANSVFVYFNNNVPTAFMQIGWTACFFIGPAVYYFFKYTLARPGSPLTPASRFAWKLLPAIMIITGIIVPYAAHPDLWCNVFAYFIYAQWVGFLIATGLLLKPYISRLFSAGTQLNTREKFWLLLFGGNCTIFLAYQVSMSGLLAGLCLAGAVAFTVILSITVFYYFYGMEMNNILQVDTNNTESRSNKKKIAEPDAIAWMEKLQKAITEEDLYKDPNLKLGDLAQKINITGHQLSQLLNDHLGKNFSTYINEYRINEACKLIATDNRLSLEAIGYEVGYNSKSTFYTAFKKIKDTTPSIFREKLS
jgi:AraC-like DNA-binding protein